MANQPKTPAEKPGKPAIDKDRLASPDAAKPDATITSRKALLLRVQAALQDAVNMTDENRVLEALSTATGMDALIHVVGNPQIACYVASRTDDPLRAARARAIWQTLDLIKAEGGCIGVEEVAAHLGITRAGVDKRRKAGHLIGIDGGSRSIKYPSWQFDQHGTLKGLKAALSAMFVKAPLMQMQFFLTVDPDLEKRPLDALRAGEIKKVVDAAHRYGRFGDDQ